MQRIIKLLIVIGALALLQACAANRSESIHRQSPMLTAPVYAPPHSGAIYAAGRDIRLFEDRKANRIGDILTVRLVEQTNASKSSQTSTDKSTDATLGNPTVFGTVLTHKGIPLFDGSLGGEQAFDGKGSSSQSNSLAGDITVTVVDRLPNGNLVISGDKWVTLNQGQEFIRLSGVIRPDDIQPDNTLVSTRIANAQITYSSKGVLAAANRMGLISRFFHSILHPY